MRENYIEREKKELLKAEREREVIKEFCVKITNLTFREKLTNLASHIKVKYQWLPSKEDTSWVT